MVDAAITEIVGAQRPDGYLNTYFTFERTANRWTDFDLHEMYCAGHLLQAAVAHFRATGSERLLDVATRFADHCQASSPVYPRLLSKSLPRSLFPRKRGAGIHEEEIRGQKQTPSCR
jgi:hypothetical protein